MNDTEIRVNGAYEPYAPTLAELLSSKGLDGAKGLAVARNGQVVARSAWAETHLEPGDEIELVRAVGGG